jgi:hypothetical protein
MKLKARQREFLKVGPTEGGEFPFNMCGIKRPHLESGKVRCFLANMARRERRHKVVN